MGVSIVCEADVVLEIGGRLKPTAEGDMEVRVVRSGAAICSEFRGTG